MKKLALIFALGILTVLVACKDDPEDHRTAFERTNDWMYANMEYWYYWTDQLPSKPATNINPDDFYHSLLYREDRFSFIFEDYQELLNLLGGISLESGYEYKLYLEDAGSENVILQIVYIKAGAPASEIDLKRGDIIYQINGTQMTTANYQDLLSQLNSPYTATYKRFDRTAETFQEMGDFSLTPITFSENPVLLDTTYDLGGKKIGYFIYTFFAPGNSGAYDAAVDAAMANFKAQGIQELIVDLRFNSGGSETSARNLSSLLVKNATSADLMFRKQYNDNIQGLILDDPDLGEAFVNVNFSDKQENIGNLLSSNTVYFITSPKTASASEVVINAIIPYMDVYLVGDTTVGKDVGSVTLYEDDNPENLWGIQPIVVKLVNSNGDDYPTGFYPQVPLKDNFLILDQLGDTQEPLLNAALAAIGVQPGRYIPEIPTTQRTLFNSLDLKLYRNQVLMEEIVPFK